ncbi:MAG: type II toxin-antitoxin system RelE/ParE family toxin [Planctomycetes bacterium]|nr:type II toxin-antitoxin system RelE/ParE family toxin [Planctomycetota bacterium]
MYEVLVERRAERDLNRLPHDLFDRVIRAVKSLADNPRPQGSRKLTASENDWRIRVGDYRVLYEIDDPSQAVRVMRVRHRREAYR